MPEADDVPAENIGDEIESTDKPEDIPEEANQDETPSDSLTAEPLPENIEETGDGDEDMEQREPVVEEVCVKKFAYVTTDEDEEVQVEPTMPEIPEKSAEGKKLF